jgi:hypothetical protein
VRLRVRYFTDGVVLGSKAFVEVIFEVQRERFGPKRKQGARRMTESEAPFYTLRQMRLRLVESSGSKQKASAQCLWEKMQTPLGTTQRASLGGHGRLH